MVAGTLEIQLLAGIARLQKDMAEAQQVVGGAMRNIEGSIATVRRAFGALGISVGVGVFAAMIKGSIDAADNLRDLSKTTNIAVEDLAGLQLAAKQTGTDLSSLAGGINKFMVNIGKDQDKFRALGITAKEPLQAFKQLADIFVAIQDPQLRAAVMAEALGRSWQTAAPLLAEGGEKIQQMVDRGKLLSGLTKELTDRADEFNDQWAEITTLFGASRTKLAGDFLPSLNEISRAMAEAAKEGGVLLTVWVGLGGALAQLLGMGDAQKLKTRIEEIDAALERARKQAASGTTMPKGAGGFWSFLIPDVRVTEEMLEGLRINVAALEAERERLMPTKKPVVGDGADEKAINAIIAEERARQFLADKEMYAARIAALKGFSAAFAADIKTQGTLLELSYKEAGIKNQRTQEELILAQSALREKELRSQLETQQKIKALAQAQGPSGAKDAEVAAQQIMQINAAILANETITQAQIRAERTVTAQRQQAEYQTWLDSRIAVGESIAQGLMNETELENLEYVKRRENLQLYIQSRGDDITNGQELEAQLAAQHAFRLYQIERNKEQLVQDARKQTLNLAVGLLNALAGKSKAAALAAIALQKGLMIAETIASTQAAAMRALAELGPIAGPPAAVAIEALGAAKVGIIAATGLVEAHNAMGGGAGSGSTSNSGGFVGSPVFPANPITGAPVGTSGRGTTTIINLYGQNYTRDQVRDLLEMQNEHSVDGGRTIVVTH